MDDIQFLERIFQGYVNYYGALRCHTQSSYTDITQLEINFFADLGLKMGFIPKKEHTEIIPPHLPYAGGCSNPRDLCWLDPDQNFNVALHLERETQNGNAARETVNHPDNMLLHGAQFPGGRYLVGVFGWVTQQTLNDIRHAIEHNQAYQDKNVLIIAWVGDNREHPQRVVGLVYAANGQRYERHAIPA